MKKVKVKGVIISNDDKWIYDWLGYESTSPNDVNKTLEDANGEDIVVEINSGGGSVFAGHEIYTAIRGYSGKKEINVVGLAGSAASEILTAAESQITPVGMVMIHNASSRAEGDYREMDKKSSFLKKVNKSIMNAYMDKTGKTEEELAELMDKETWMTADEAVENGFVDSIMFSTETKELDNIINSSNSKGAFDNTPQLSAKVIEKLRNTIKLQEPNNPSIENNKPLDQPDVKPDPKACILDKNNPEGGKKMNLEDLMKEHPEITAEIDQIKVTAKEEGITEERTRIQAIDNIADSVPGELVAKAKYTETMNASELALKVISDSAAKGENYFKAALEDSKESGVDDVTATPSDADEDEDEALINIAAKAANEKRKVVN